MFKRRRQLKTNYRKRLGLVKSGKSRLVVRRFNKNFRVQFVNYSPEGDKVVCDIVSKQLTKYNWNHNTANIPSAYLTGLLAGKKAKQKGVAQAVLDIGLHNSTKQNSIYAVGKGVADAGVDINLNQEVVPSAERISGKHIADYASQTKSQKGLGVTDDFEKVKKAIING